MTTDKLNKRFDEAQEKVRGSMKITTNIRTPEGTQIAICWGHLRKDGSEEPTCVMASNIDEALRKVIEYEIDAAEAEAKP